jgi:signal transduction histidine kinase
MNYGRPLKLRISKFSYHELIGKAMPLLHDKLTEQRVKVVTALAPDLPPMEADKEMMRNCLFNFITNGAQAMPEGGEITLGAGFDREAELFRLTFTDQGEGITADDIDKIFQPYFTTKEAGIGLGLAITERIIKEHGGEITVASRPGEGTTFTVVLPAKSGSRVRLSGGVL